MLMYLLFVKIFNYSHPHPWNPFIAPGSPEYYLEESLRFYQIGRYEESIKSGRKALSLRPGYDLAYNNICAAYNALGEWDKGVCWSILCARSRLRIFPIS
jgi:tetratricopeptide (TPR) repeat protein